MKNRRANPLEFSIFRSSPVPVNSLLFLHFLLFYIFPENMIFPKTPSGIPGGVKKICLPVSLLGSMAPCSLQGWYPLLKAGCAMHGLTVKQKYYPGVRKMLKNFLRSWQRLNILDIFGKRGTILSRMKIYFLKISMWSLLYPLHLTNLPGNSPWRRQGKLVLEGI